MPIRCMLHGRRASGARYTLGLATSLALLAGCEVEGEDQHDAASVLDATSGLASWDANAPTATDGSSFADAGRGADPMREAGAPPDAASGMEDAGTHRDSGAARIDAGSMSDAAGGPAR